MSAKRVVYHDFAKTVSDSFTVEERLERIEALQRIILQEQSMQRQQNPSSLKSPFWVRVTKFMLIVTSCAAVITIASTIWDPLLRIGFAGVQTNSIIPNSPPELSSKNRNLKASVVREAKRLQRTIQRDCKRTIGCADRTGGGNKLY